MVDAGNDFLTLSGHPAGMSCYRRFHVPGATYAFTVNLAVPGTDVLVSRIDVLRQAWRATLAEHPFRCDAVVVLPDHLHAVWTLPPGDADFSTRWRKIKARFTRWTEVRGTPSASKTARREAGLWQRRFWEHMVRDAAELDRMARHCWTDPVRHGLVACPTDWPYSSLHRDIRLGLAAAGDRLVA
jgi:putative transposase